MSSTESLPSRLSDATRGDGATVPDVLFRLTARRRRVLELLLEAGAPVTVRELALRIAATEADHRPSSLGDSAVETVEVELGQVDLPVLADVELVSVDADAGRVTTSEHPVYDERWFRLLLASEEDDADAILRGLADDRRLHVLDQLAGCDGGLTRDELAERLARDETDATVESVRLSLHHVHLPTLVDAGLVEPSAVDGAPDTCAGEAAYALVGSPSVKAWLQTLGDG